MAIASNQSFLDGIEGRTGPYVTRTLHDKTIIQGRSKGRSKKSEAEKNNHNRFKEASVWAKAQMLDPEVKAYFQSISAQNSKKYSNAYTAALSFRLKELNAAQKSAEKLEAKHTTMQSSDVAPGNDFNIVREETEKLFSHLLGNLTQYWINIGKANLNNKQEEVLRSIVRQQIMQKLRKII